LAEARQFDAIVVGSGLGGSCLAHRLAANRRRVLVIERGGFLRAEPVVPGQSVGKYIDHVVRQGEPLAFVGGATKFYGAALYRLRESDFRETPLEAGVSPAWPMSYSDLEPYYAEAESLFRVHGAVGKDPSEPHRSDPFPFRPVPHDPIIATMVKALERSGTAVAPIPLGLDYGNGGACRVCGTCDGYFCQIDAKMDAEIAALRPALATGFVTLLTGATCERILTNHAGTAVEGVEVNVDGETRTYRSHVVAASCGVPDTALLLRKSRNSVHPDGLGNDHGKLGRYMGGHFTGVAFPLVSWRSMAFRHTKTIAINQFYEASADWPFPTGMIQLAGQTPVWERVWPMLRPIVKAFATRSVTCFYMTEAAPTLESGLVFAGDTIERTVSPPLNRKTFSRLRRLTFQAFRQAGYIVLPRARRYLWHWVGTARMGADPTMSVADSDCMVHGIAGLYIADASVLPSAGAVNTGLTVAALALRTGDAIVHGVSRSAA
jgi:choline dehydrogenase-like flavoprotein